MRNTNYGMAICLALLAAQGVSAHGPARKSTVPARKAGLWEVTVRSDDLVLRRQGAAPQRPQTVQMCTSAEAEPVMLFAVVPAQENCRETKTRLRAKSEGGGYDIATVCYVHDNRVDMHMELRGDLQSAYSGAFSVKYAQTPLGNTGRMLFEGRWLGTCNPGQRQGDMVLPNGITVNVVDDQKRAEALHAREVHDHTH